mmetsp:Transcript_1991/g.3184  ORF Transcript_1991/g.3184 Transcript_1991/m.3184 type:complete len:83 (+) Transcript_1991:428-676(+)
MIKGKHRYGCGTSGPQAHLCSIGESTTGKTKRGSQLARDTGRVRVQEEMQAAFGIIWMAINILSPYDLNQRSKNQKFRPQQV